jgi:hypothetical protein
MMLPKDLTRLFCLKKKQDDPLLGDQHVRTVAHYVQEQIHLHLGGKPN